MVSLKRAFLPSISLAIYWVCVASCIGDQVIADQTGLQKLQTQAGSGDAAAQELLSEAYYFGKGVKIDYQAAYFWDLKAAVQGNALAQLNLGYFYHFGQGVDKDEKASFEWCLKAAQKGNMEAERIVANDYLTGAGVSKDAVQAFLWYNKRAIAGDAHAKRQVGMLYLSGTGVEKNVEKGFTYLLAAAYSDSVAAYQVAACYQKGTFVSSNNEKAYQWALISQHSDPNGAAQQLIQSLKPLLKPDQLREANNFFQTFPNLAKGFIQTPELNIKPPLLHEGSVSFGHRQNGIFIPIQIQGQSVGYFLLDTGSNASLLMPRFAASCGLVSEDYYSLNGSGPDLILGAISKPLSFTIAGASFDHARMLILPSDYLSSFYGFPIAGIMGSDLLKTLVVRINFTNGRVQFIDHSTFDPKTEKGESIPLSFPQGIPVVQGKVINNTIESSWGDFEIDTGSNGGILLSKTFQTRNTELNVKPFASFEATGLGGKESLSQSKFSAFLLDSLQVRDPIMDLALENQGFLSSATAGRLGNDFWRRFNITIDYPDSILFLDKNENFSEPFLYSSVGLSIEALGDNYDILTVEAVSPDGSASKAGFLPKDVIVAVNEAGSKQLSVDDFYAFLRKDGVYHVRIRRNGQELLLTLAVTSNRQDVAPVSDSMR